MADGLRCAEFKGAGLGLEVLDWLGYAGRRWAQRCARSRLGKEALAQEALVSQGCAGKGGAGQKTAG